MRVPNEDGLPHRCGTIAARRGNTAFNHVIPIILIIWAVTRTGESSQAA